MTRVRIFDNMKEDSALKTVAFTDADDTTVIIIVNPSGEESLKIGGVIGDAEIYLTDTTHNCEKIYEGKFEKNITIPEKSIMTIRIK